MTISISDQLALAALIVSVFSLCLSAYLALSNRPNLRVVFRWDRTFASLAPDAFVIMVHNNGRVATTIRRIGLSPYPNRERRVVEIPQYKQDCKLPSVLDPGHEYELLISKGFIQQSIDKIDTRKVIIQVDHSWGVKPKQIVVKRKLFEQ